MVIRSKSDKSDNSNCKDDDTIKKNGRSTVPVARVRVSNARMVRIPVVRVSIAVMRLDRVTMVRAGVVRARIVSVSEIVVRAREHAGVRVKVRVRV